MQKLHRLLLSTRFSKPITRWVGAKVKKVAGAADATLDMRRVIESGKPIAILDIGSHVGETISRFREFTELPIFGFEPSPDTFERLQRRFANQANITVHPIALSNGNGTATFNLNANEQTNSLLANDTGNETILSEYTRPVASTAVQTRRLDDWLEEHLPEGDIFIKSDVQGAEGLLIEGGPLAFANRVVGFFGEAQLGPMYKGQSTLWDLNETLTKQFDFALSNIYPVYRDAGGRALQTDALWIHNRLLEA
ncbi:2-O-methyltransferase NoeI [Rubripirellula tenax]|uniref:2-O-methyltransferase NoeI n=1 Tax=Rubripirellula tenax TaxID=2528015 RepID=A0A5C6EEX6_9BACT|nr:FkbM family methyltransferase [Rubripirellula tenax]TWU47572.1 2-O-methyltransferase NoeI [Rubripirellula tenax]